MFTELAAKMEAFQASQNEQLQAAQAKTQQDTLTFVNMLKSSMAAKHPFPPAPPALVKRHVEHVSLPILGTPTGNVTPVTRAGDYRKFSEYMHSKFADCDFSNVDNVQDKADSLLVGVTQLFGDCLPLVLMHLFATWVSDDIDSVKDAKHLVEHMRSNRLVAEAMNDPPVGMEPETTAQIEDPQGRMDMYMQLNNEMLCRCVKLQTPANAPCWQRAHVKPVALSKNARSMTLHVIKATRFNLESADLSDLMHWYTANLPAKFKCTKASDSHFTATKRLHGNSDTSRAVKPRSFARVPVCRAVHPRFLIVETSLTIVCWVV